MRKITSDEYDDILQKQKEQKAVDDLAEMLCGSRRIPKETMDCAPQPYTADVKELDMETGTMRLVDKAELQPDPVDPEEMSDNTTAQQSKTMETAFIADEPPITIEEIPKGENSKEDRNMLALYNAAISSLDQLNREGIDDYEVSIDADQLLNRLKQVRINTFEHMVPWERIVEGK